MLQITPKMSTNDPIIDFKIANSMDDEEKQLVTDKLKMLLATYDFKAHHPSGITKEDIEQFPQRMLEAIMPKSYQNISASNLKQMVIDDILKHTSILMIKHYARGSLTFNIDTSMESVLPELIKNWDSQGFKINQDKKEITLKWL